MQLPKRLEELNHAYIVSCDARTLIEALGRCGVPRVGCPDVYIYECQEFKIDEARSLRDRTMLNPIVLSRRVFIISCASITIEAQNALLKTLEEPRGNAVFFFLLPSPERLLPTFLSRTQLLKHNISLNHATSAISAQKFFRAEPAERIKMLEIFTKKKEEEERDMISINSFLTDLEQVLNDEREVEGLKAVYRAKRYLFDKGAVIKPLLEQVALLA